MEKNRGVRTGLVAGACLFVLLVAACVSQELGDRQPGQELLYLFMADGDLESADLLLDNCWPVERSEPWCIDGMPEWNTMLDPYDENYWEMVFYALRPLRHLIWAYEETGDAAYVDKLIEIMHSFADTYPTNNPNWDPHTSSFRLMMLVQVYWKLDEWGELDDDLRSKLEDHIFGISSYLYEPAHFESGYNHGFTEAAALLLASANFPERNANSGCGGITWSERALRRMDTLMEDAVDEDGVEVEQSPYYHFYVLNFSWQIDTWSQAYGIPLSDFFHDQFEAMIHYATLIPTPDGFVPLIGSSIQKNVQSDSLGLLPAMGEVYPELMYIVTAGEQGTEPTETAALFPSSGQFIARSGFGPVEEFAQQTHLIFDVGSYRTDHSHRDALALHLYANGLTVLPDSGLYSYEVGDLANYFPHTRAHNTVVVDDGGQASGDAEARNTLTGDGWAYQSGYHSLYDTVVHDRGVLLVERDLVLVVDRLDSNRDREYAQTWHFPFDIEPVGDATALTVVDGDALPVLTIHQALPEELELSLISGQESPVVQGWYSEIYEEAMPRYAAEYRVEAHDAWFVTLLATGPYAGQDATLVLDELDGQLNIVMELETRSWQVEIEALFEEDEYIAVTYMD